MAKERNKPTEEFKRDAVRLMRNRGKGTVAQVADDLSTMSGSVSRRPARSSSSQLIARVRSSPARLRARRAAPSHGPLGREVAPEEHDDEGEDRQRAP
jgi:transposase-like protein